MRFLIIIGLLAIAEYYSFVVVKSATGHLSTPWRVGLISFYIFLTLISWLGFLLFRQINWANVPHLLRNMYIAFVMGFAVGKILVLLVMLIDDIRRLFTWLIEMFLQSPTGNTAPPEQKGISRSDFLMKLSMLLAATTVGGFIYGVTNRYRYQVRRLSLKYSNLPANFRGLKIVQISDIHTGSFDNHAAVQHGIDLINKENADLVFFTGDLVNNMAKEVDDTYKKIFAGVRAKMGVYSILGNHDYGDYMQWPTPEAKINNLNTLKQLHADMGWRLLLNEHVLLQKGTEEIALLGIENWSAKMNFARYGSLAHAYAGLQDKNSMFKILLSHDPSHWDAEVKPNYPDINLTLSGHTHGMQFGVDSKYFKWSPVQYVYNKWAGLYGDNPQHLYVNRGFGFIGYPGRVGILPEITVFELV